MMNDNILPYMRKVTSTLLVLSTAIAMLLLASPLLPFSKALLQPVQAQTAMTFGTPTPAISEEGGSLTFEAHGTNTSSDFKTAKITGGTFNNTGEDGTIRNGNFNNNSGQNSLDLAVVLNNPPQDLFVISTSCSTSTFNLISVGGVPYRGAVECSTKGGGNTASSSSMTGTAQDSDGDGIPDSSDRCTHNSNHRCFKEDTTTQQQQQPSSSSSNSTGNQTKG
jgi:hypothetical protein